MSDDPDYVFNSDDWEVTFEYSDMSILFDDCLKDEIVTVGCLKKLPDQFAVYVVTEKDADGDALQGSWELFPTEKAAKAAISNARGLKS